MGICCSTKRDYEQELFEMKERSERDQVQLKESAEKEVELTDALVTNRRRVSVLAQEVATLKAQSLAAEARASDARESLQGAEARMAREREAAAVAHQAICKALRDDAAHKQARAAARLCELEAALAAASASAKETQRRHDEGREAIRNKEHLLRTTNKKLMQKICEQRAMIGKLVAREKAVRARCDAILGLHGRPKEVRRVVMEICGASMPRDERLLYCHFTQVLLKHLSERKEAAGTRGQVESAAPSKRGPSPPPGAAGGDCSNPTATTTASATEESVVDHGVNWIASWFDNDE